MNIQMDLYLHIYPIQFCQLLNFGMFYEVEAILDKKINQGKPWYRVKWLNYPISQATWQPPYTLSGAKQLIQQFQANFGSRSFDESILQDNDYGLSKEDFVSLNRKRRRKKKRASIEDPLIIETKQLINQLETNRDPYSESMAMKNEAEELYEEDLMQCQGENQNLDQQLKLEIEKNQMIPEIERQNEMEIEEQHIQENEPIQEEPVVRKQEILKQITYLKAVSNKENCYLIEKADGSLQKIETKDLIKQYPKSFYSYLESVLQQKLRI